MSAAASTLRRTDPLALGLGLVVTFGTSLAAVALFSGNTLQKAAVAAVLLAAGTMLLSGNTRLCCLYGLVLSAPLELGKQFQVVRHMGGALSYRIDLVDLFALALLAYQLHDWRAGRRLRLPWLALPWLALTLLGSMFILAGPFRSLAGMEVVRMLKCFLIFLALVNELPRVPRIGHAVVAILGATLLQVGVGIAQYVLDRQLGLQMLGEASEESVQLTSASTLTVGIQVNRVGALLGHSNVLGAFLALSLPLAAALVFSRVDLRIRLLSLATLLLGTFALLVTLSRTAWVGYTVGMAGVLVLGALNPQARGRFALRRLLTVGVLGALLVMFSRSVFLRLFHSDPEALRSRLEWVQVALNMVRAEPFFGHGLNAYVFTQAPFTRFHTMEALLKAYGEVTPVVHNNYLIVWSEQGTVGLVLFLALQVMVLRMGLRNLRVRHETLFAINLGCLCGLASMMIDWLASFSLRIETTTRMYWILVALLCAIDAWRRAHPPRAAGSVAPAAAPA
jgi:putative inorganic carbon (HCO3(-)) transporter